MNNLIQFNEIDGVLCDALIADEHGQIMMMRFSILCFKYGQKWRTGGESCLMLLLFLYETFARTEVDF